MKRCLIVFTRKYPYSYGEPSLDAEFRHHLPFYDRIIVLAQDVSMGEEPTRKPIPEVEYHNTARASRRAGRAGDVLRSARRLFTPGKAVLSDAARVRFSPLRRCFLWYFEERCDRLIREAMRVLNGIDLTGYDHIVLYSYWFFANVRVAVGVKQLLKAHVKAEISVVSRAHRYDLYEYSNRLNYLPEREYLLERVDSVWACSGNGAEYLKKKYPKYAEKIGTAYVGTADFGLGAYTCGGEFQIVSCCRVVPVKRLELLIEALSLVGHGKVLWTAIGGGIDGDGYFNQVQQKAREALDGHPNVRYTFTGALAHDDVFRFYREQSVDAFLNVSASEGLPAVLMEASSFGIPVVATDVGGTSEIVRNGENGYLLPPDFKPEQLSRLIEQIAGMPPDEMARMRVQARRIWSEAFHSDRNYAAFARLVARVGEGEA